MCHGVLAGNPLPDGQFRTDQRHAGREIGCTGLTVDEARDPHRLGGLVGDRQREHEVTARLGPDIRSRVLRETNPRKHIRERHGCIVGGRVAVAVVIRRHRRHDIRVRSQRIGNEKLGDRAGIRTTIGCQHLAVDDTGPLTVQITEHRVGQRIQCHVLIAVVRDHKREGHITTGFRNRSRQCGLDHRDIRQDIREGDRGVVGCLVGVAVVVGCDRCHHVRVWRERI